MHRKMKKILVFALVLTMLMPLGSAFAAEDTTGNAVNSTSTSDTQTSGSDDAALESIDIDTKTTVEYVTSSMKLIGRRGEYTIYTGSVKEIEELEKLIDKSEKVEAEDYTEESYKVYSEALEAAKTVFANVSSTQYELDSAWIRLDRANEGLVKANAKEKTEKEETGDVNVTKLEKAVTNIEKKLGDKIVEETYTEYTWEIFDAAYENAKKVLASPASQAQVDAAKEELDYTEDMLTEKPADIFAVIRTASGEQTLMSTFEVAEAENGSVISISKNGNFIVEADAGLNVVKNFYIRLLSENVENAFVTTSDDKVYYLNKKTLEVDDEYVFESEDEENGRKYTNDSGRIIYTSLDGKRLISDIELVAENANFKLYADTKNYKVGLYDIKADKFWWNTPVDPYGDSTIIDDTKNDPMTLVERRKAASGLILQYGELAQGSRSISSLYSTSVFSDTDGGSEEWKINKNGVTVTYNFKKDGFIVPVNYILHEDRLEVSVDVSKVTEVDTNAVDGNVLTGLSMAPSFGAASTTDLAGNPIDGYMIVPDGSGAVIEYNNQKYGYEPYEQILYGRDKTTVPDTAPKVTEQAYLPLVATVSGNTGLVAIATDGDANASVTAQVSKQENQAYNKTYFTFTLRTKDEYSMGGTDGTKITVFEGGKIKTKKISVSYYPISVSENDEVNYADVAAVYRNYLINEKGLEKKTQADTSNFYVDLYGGVLKETSILGIPVDMKTEITGFSQAEEILSQLSEGGVNDMIVNYNDWTNKSMVGKISTSFKPSGVLGGKSDYESFVSSAEKLDAEIFPSVSNMEMAKNTWGFMTINSTAIRVSKAQSRQSLYSTAFGVKLTGKAPALLTPNSYSKAMDKMIKSFSKNDAENIGFGDYANTLVSDFSKRNALSREGTMQSLVEKYKKASKELDKVIADSANSYIIPYADYITNVPVYSSQFNIVNYDIPLYQMVVHGYVPYSSTPVNANSNAEEVFLLSLASGSGIHYDMIYEDAYELLDTDYADLYYANYNSWMNQAVEQYKVSEDILSQVSEMVITDYQIDNETGVITTTYDDKVVVKVDMKNATAEVNGTIYDLSSAMEGGLQG